MKKQIKIWFSDFTDDIDIKNNYFTELLNKNFKLIFDEDNPDYLFYSSYGFNFLKYKHAIKIYYTGENLVPDFNLCDYAIGFHFMELQDRYLRFPNFGLFPDQFQKLIRKNKNSSELLTSKPYFCNYIYSNSGGHPYREEFFHSLSKYKKVFAPGNHLNNCDFQVGKRYGKDWMYTKLDFQSKNKFSIAFENSSCSGYTTEKILHAFISNTIPIYWGNPDVVKDFNPKSFINCHEYETTAEIIAKIKELDENESLYLETLNEPPLANNTIPKHLREEKLLDFLNHIFSQEIKNAYRRPKYGFVEKYEKKLFNLINNQTIQQKLRNYSRKIFD